MTQDMIYQLVVAVIGAAAGYFARRWQVPGGDSAPAPSPSPDKPLLNLLLGLLAKRGGLPAQAFQAEVLGEGEPVEVRADGHVVTVGKDGAITVRKGE